jgi:hypothetical protein
VKWDWGGELMTSVHNIDKEISISLTAQQMDTVAWLAGYVLHPGCPKRTQLPFFRMCGLSAPNRQHQVSGMCQSAVLSRKPQQGLSTFMTWRRIAKVSMSKTRAASMAP